MNKKTKKGFTITELVIVIAVIAILAAVLIPTFSNVIKNANESVALQEARSEWDNFAPEIATLDANNKGDYLIVYHKEGKEDKYFLAKNGQFDETVLTGITLGTPDAAGTYTVVTVAAAAGVTEKSYNVYSVTIAGLTGYTKATDVMFKASGADAKPTTGYEYDVKKDGTKMSSCNIYKLG